MPDLPLAAFPLLDSLLAWWSLSGAPLLTRLLDWLSDLPAALMSLQKWQSILAPATGGGAVVGLFWKVDRYFTRTHPLLQRLHNMLGFAAFGLLCGFAVVYVMVMIAPILTK